MDISNIIHMFLHLDKYLGVLVQNYGVISYGILFLIIFCETGLVVLPFLPGDSILFATGALAATKVLNIEMLFIGFYFAAVLGDTVNYEVGKKLGNKIIQKENSKFISKNHIEKAQKFYEKYGGVTVIIARFIPIVRTFAPFVAGIGEMKYKKFAFYNFLGGFLWVTLFLGSGYLFGGIPFIKNNFSCVVIAIIIISIIPGIITYLKERKKTDDNIKKVID